MADEIFVGSVAVGLVPSAEGFAEKARSALVPSASSIGDEWGSNCSDRMQAGLGNILSTWGAKQTEVAKTTGADAGTGYAEAFKTKVDEILAEIDSEVNVTGNTEEAQAQVDELKASLEELKSKTIGVDMTNTEAMDAIDQIKVAMDDLQSKGILIEADNKPAIAAIDEVKTAAGAPVDVPVIANTKAATAAIDELRAMAAKPVVVPVETASTGAAASGAASGAASDSALAGGALAAGAADTEKEGEAAAETYGSGFMAKITGFLGAGGSKLSDMRESGAEKFADSGKEAGGEFGGAFSGILGSVMSIGVPAAIAGAALAVSAVYGEKLEGAENSLKATMTNAGYVWSDYSDKVEAVNKDMTEYGFTSDQVEASLQKVLQQTGSMADALGAESTIAKLATATHVSLASATTTFDRALTGNAKTLKQYDIIQASGATSGAAMTKAQQDLANQINQSGSMAAFAASKHLSLAQAQDLVTSAAGESAPALSKLSDLGLSYTSATKLQTDAMSGSTKAMATLKKDHLTLAQLTQLNTDSVSGNIGAYNKLGIEVLPKSASAAQNYAQVQSILNDKLGGQASAVTDSFSGKIHALGAELIDAAEGIGIKVMPALDEVIGFLVKMVPTIEAVISAISKFGGSFIIVSLFTGVSTILKVLLGGPMRDITLAIAGLVIGWLALNVAMEVNPFIAIGTAIVLLVGIVVKYHAQIVSVIEGAWNTVTNFLKQWWPLIAAIVTAGMSVIVQLIIKYHQDIVNAIEAAWNAVVAFIKQWWPVFAAVATSGMSLVVQIIVKYHQDIVNAFETAWNTIKSTVTAAWSWMQAAYNAATSAISTAWKTAWAAIVAYFTAEWTAIKTAVTSAWSWVQAAYNAALAAIKAAWNAAWLAVYNYLNTTFTNVKNAVTAVFTWMKSTFTSGVSAISTAWKTGWTAVTSTTTTVINTIKTAWNTFFSGLQTAFKAAVSAIGSIWNGVQAAVQKPVSFVINSVYDPIAKVFDSVTSFLGLGSPLPQVKMASGGIVPGGYSRDDNQLVWMRSGEGVLQPGAVSALGGESFINWANSMFGDVPSSGSGNGHFAGGGVVPTAAPGRGGALGAVNPTGGNLNPIAQIAGDVVSFGKELGRLVRGALAGAVGPILTSIADVTANEGGGTWGKAVAKIPSVLVKDMISWITGQDANDAGDGGGGSGAEVAQYAASFSTGLGHPYVTGGQGPGGWDCSGFSAYVYEHFGYFPGGQKERYGTSESQYSSSLLQESGATPGALVFFDDNFYPDPGHVGVLLSANSYVGADSPAVGTTTHGIAGAVGFRIPKGGFQKQDPSGSNGSELGNGAEVYKYLLADLFGGNKIAAAGATASIWGESMWNPESQGTGGRGLIGWTPVSTLPNSAFTGNAAKDMAAQLPLILKFVTSSGDSSVIAQMFQAASISQAAQLWMQGVERAGVTDVHSTGLALATQIMNGYARGTKGAAPGWAMVGEQGMELVKFNGGEEVLSHDQSMSALGGLGAIPGAGYWQGTATGTPAGDFASAGAASFKSALAGVEAKLDAVVKATKNVGSDVGGTINAAGRRAGSAGNFNNVGRR
jgi:phage-related protein